MNKFIYLAPIYYTLNCNKSAKTHTHAGGHLHLQFFVQKNDNNLAVLSAPDSLLGSVLDY